MQSLQSLPVEDLYEICSHLDPLSLKNLANTSNELRDRCEYILGKRRKEFFINKFKDSLWVRCFSERSIFDIIKVRTRLTNKGFEVVQYDTYTPPVLGRMEVLKDRLRYYKIIQINDIDQLNELYDNLYSYSFKDTGIAKVYIVLYKYSKNIYYPTNNEEEFKSLESLQLVDVNYIARLLNITLVNNLEQMKQIIYDELSLRGLIFPCKY